MGEASKKTTARQEAYWCRVHYLDRDVKNKDTAPITVGSKSFRQGEKVALKFDEIRELRNAAITTRTMIPMDSEIYRAFDPWNEARRHYPGHTIERDFSTGALYAVHREPKFLVEIVEPWPVRIWGRAPTNHTLTTEGL